jgi:hypothetical protein
VYVLIHSPLIGPFTWSLVANELRQRGLIAILPALHDSPAIKQPYWQQHAASIAQALAEVPKSVRLILVAHSGAGPLLPAIRQSIANPVHAYVFVDAGIPVNGASRLDLMRLEDAEWAVEFQKALENGERFPTWSFDDLQEIIPDESLRRQTVAELQPRGLDFFTEPIPVFDGWPDAPCIYIQFSESYDWDAAQARQFGWPTYKVEAGHFHMLVDAPAVATIIMEAANTSL